MPITQLELLNATCPFDVTVDEQPEGMKQTVRGFGKDPSGTRTDAAFFTHGGWLLLRHLMQNYSMAKEAIQ